MPVSSSEGTRLYQRKTSKQSARFFPLVFRKQGNRSQDGVSVKYLIMRGSIYYAHKESSLLPWASIFSFFLFFWFFCRSEERTCLQSLHTPPSPCLHPNGNSFSLAPPKPPRGLGVKGVRQYRQRPNEFLSSRLLPEPSITAAWSGETRRRRLCPGGGGAGGWDLCRNDREGWSHLVLSQEVPHCVQQLVEHLKPRQVAVESGHNFHGVPLDRVPNPHPQTPSSHT